MNVFLAGSTGAIGRPSVRILVNRGHRVFAMTRASKQEAELWKLGAIPVVKDAFDAEGLTQALRAIKPDAVIHQLTDLSLLSEPTKLQEAIERNARLRKIGTGNLLSAAIAAGADHMIAQSIAWVYQPGPEPYQETAPLDTHADGLLGVTVKGVVALESSVLATAGIQGCVLRYGHLYGPGTSRRSCWQRDASACGCSRLGFRARTRATSNRNLQRCRT